MKIPLIVTNVNGDLLYASRSVKVSGVLRIWLSANAKSLDSGIVYYEGAAIYTKQILLGGKRYRVFIDCDSAFCVGETIDRLKDGLFEVSAYKSSRRVNMSLGALLNMFVSTYLEELSESGARISVRRIASDVNVHVSPNVFAFCLSLMVRLCANAANVVNLSFANECGRVVIFVDTVGGEPLENEPHELLRVLLHEVSAAVGFKVDEMKRGDVYRIALSLTPLDVSLLGLKTELVSKYKKAFESYIAMFL